MTENTMSKVLRINTIVNLWLQKLREMQFSITNFLMVLELEYKYDWGHYQTKTFSSQTRGHLSNFGDFWKHWI